MNRFGHIPPDPERMNRDIEQFVKNVQKAKDMNTASNDPKAKTLPFYYGLIPYLWFKYVKKQDVHFIGWRG